MDRKMNSELSSPDGKLKSILAGDVPVKVLQSLRRAINPTPVEAVNINRCAIALDANVLLRLPQERQASDVIDFLSQSFKAPLILPFQTVQEFWNNQLKVVETVGAKLRKKVSEIRRDGASLGSDFSAFCQKLDGLLDEFDRDFGYALDPSTRNKVTGFVEMLSERAIMPAVDRTEYFQIAEIRKRTKTPPGFMDDGYGDFFVWVEILSAAAQALDGDHKFERLILVTNDAKEDWVREGVPHPILSAEVEALLDMPFSIWKLKDLISAIEKELA